MSIANVKLATASGRNHKRATEKESEGKMETQQAMIILKRG
jgi:hypothetical protein